ncbi:MAG TPA: peptidoglycan recognition family protein [Bacteroidales bacterium]|nr:peptidoglycan recognition family protein [Bacteroidales bacterium]
MENKQLIIVSDLGNKVINAGNARERNTNINIDKIVLHSQGIPDDFGDKKALSSIQNWFTTYRSTGKSSAHYFINFNGDIHRLVPEDAIAYHAGTNGNRNSIGIEVAGSTNRLKFTDAQVASLKILINNIKERYKIKWIYCHSDFGKPGCPFYDGSNNPLIKELNTNIS